MNWRSPRLAGHYYGTKEVSGIFGVNESTIKSWTDSGKLKCFRTLGGHRRYSADWILRFAETFNSSVASASTDVIEATRNEGNNLIDALLSENDYRALREVYFADALKGDADDLTRILIHCHSRRKISLKEIYDEIVSKAINKIQNLARQQKLNGEQEEGAINAVLESFARLKRELHAATQG